MIDGTSNRSLPRVAVALPILRVMLTAGDAGVHLVLQDQVSFQLRVVSVRLHAHAPSCARGSYYCLCLFLLAGCPSPCGCRLRQRNNVHRDPTRPHTAAHTNATTTPSNTPVISSPTLAPACNRPYSSLAAWRHSNADHSRLLLDGTSIFYGGILPMKKKWMFIPDGQHTLALTAYDKADIRSVPPTRTSTSPRRHLPGNAEAARHPAWQSCTQDLAGTACASGLGQATTAQTQNVAAPSLSGGPRSTHWATHGILQRAVVDFIGRGTPLNTFTYDLDFYIDNPTHRGTRVRRNQS